MVRKYAVTMAAAAFVTLVIDLYVASSTASQPFRTSIPSENTYLQQLILPDPSPMNDLAWSPDGHWLALASSAGMVALYDVSDFNKKPTLMQGSDVLWGLAYSPDGHWLAAGDFHGHIHIWNTASGEQVALINGHRGYIRALAFSPDSALLASGGLDHYVRLWDVKTGNLMMQLDGHAEAITEIAFSRDGTTLTSGSDDGEVRLWDIVKKTTLATLSAQAMTLHRMAFGGSGKIVSAGSKGSILLWDWKPVGGVYEFTLRHGGQPIWALAFDRNDSMLASAGADQKIHLWDVQTGAERAVLDGQINALRRIAFSPDGQLLAALSSENHLLLWSLAPG